MKSWQVWSSAWVWGTSKWRCWSRACLWEVVKRSDLADVLQRLDDLERRFEAKLDNEAEAAEYD